MDMSNSNRFGGVKRAVFIDRDGTINIEKEYLYRVEDFEFIPGAPEAILRLNRAGWLVFVITNQSGIARGYYNEQDLARLHEHIDRLLGRIGARVDGWYFCPHFPSGTPPYNIECDCRKPLPGMLLKAAADHSADLSESWMIGDKLVDVEAGLSAGCHAILVRTGYGVTSESRLPEGVSVTLDIASAVDMILAV